MVTNLEKFKKEREPARLYAHNPFSDITSKEDGKIFNKLKF